MRPTISGLMAPRAADRRGRRRPRRATAGRSARAARRRRRRAGRSAGRGSHGRPHYNRRRDDRRDPPPRPPVRAVIFDAGNTLLRMNYAIIAEYLAGRGHAVDEAGVRGGAAGARAPRPAPGARRSLHREHGDPQALPPLPARAPGITDDDEIEAIARWRRAYNPPVGLWNRADPEAAAALGRVKRAGLVAGVISNSNGSVRSILEETGLARVSRLRPRLLRRGRGEARSAHLPAGAARGAGSPRRRRSTSATSTRWTCSGRARPGSTASCSTRAASGGRATAGSRAASTRPCAWCSARLTRSTRPHRPSPEGRRLTRERHEGVAAEGGVDLALHVLDRRLGAPLEAQGEIRIGVRRAHEAPALGEEDADAVDVDRLVARSSSRASSRTTANFLSSGQGALSSGVVNRCGSVSKCAETGAAVAPPARETGTRRGSRRPRRTSSRRRTCGRRPRRRAGSRPRASCA